MYLRERPPPIIPTSERLPPIIYFKEADFHYTAKRLPPYLLQRVCLRIYFREAASHYTSERLPPIIFFREAAFHYTTERLPPYLLQRVSLSEVDWEAASQSTSERLPPNLHQRGCLQIYFREAASQCIVIQRGYLPGHSTSVRLLPGHSTSERLPPSV